MRHEKLLQMRNTNIITTPEYMVLYNFYFRNINFFIREMNFSKKRARELFVSGINKIKKNVKTLENKN